LIIKKNNGPQALLNKGEKSEVIYLYLSMEIRKFETEMKLMILYHMTYPLEVKGQGSRQA
jgi:hypothetical protein